MAGLPSTGPQAPHRGPTEHELTRRVVSYMRSLQKAGKPLWFKKNFGGGFGAGFSSAHTPDFTGCANGRFFAIELKNPSFENPSDHLTPGQRLSLMSIQRAGGATLCCNRLEDVVSFLTNLL